MWNNTVVRSGSRSSDLLFKNRKIEWYAVIAISALVALALFYLFSLSDGLSGGMDSYNHYLIARYSPAHPELFLHYWGKPVYNIIASPFTQFGISGSVILNILCLIGSAILVYKTANTLGLKNPFIAFILCLLSPIFLDNTVSSLTEPLNAFLLVWVIYLLTRKKLITAAVITGFLPYARSEGFILAAVIGFYLIFILKDRRSIIYLLLGSVFFNFLGWMIEGEPFWVITQNPYLKFQLSGDNVCGSGPFIHYIRWGHVTFGFAACLLIAVSFFYSAKDLIKRKLEILSFLFPAIFISYFGIHSLIWGLGMMGSCGYIRVMVVIAPIAALMAAYGFEQLKSKLNSTISSMLSIGLILIAIAEPIKYYNYKYPIGISEEQELYEEFNKWYQESEYLERTKVYMYPYFSMIADIDPWDRAQHDELWSSSLPFYKKGDLIIWDGHFGPNEAGIPLSQLQDDPQYKFIKAFKPQKEIKTLNNYSFEIYVFEKL